MASSISVEFFNCTELFELTVYVKNNAIGEGGLNDLKKKLTKIIYIVWDDALFPQ